MAIIGLVVSAGYSLFLVAIVKSDWESFQTLRPNEWGDFLAGSFGPLAIFWLILGFFQQGKELSNSVEALRLQAEELKNTVEQQKNMVAITERQLTLDIAIREDQINSAAAQDLPFAILRGGGWSSVSGQVIYSFYIRNVGQTSIETEIAAEGQIFFGKIVINLGYLAGGQDQEFNVNCRAPLSNNEDYIFIISTKNVRGKPRRQTFKFGNGVFQQIDIQPF